MESVGEYEERKESEISEIQNLCITCKRDMGLDNPRQLCGKFKCDYIEYMSEDEIDTDKEKQNTIDTGSQDIETLDEAPLTYEEQYEEIFKNFTPEFYDWAKEHFLDKCASGDYYIHDLLDELNLICNKNIIPDTTMKIKYYIGTLHYFYKTLYTKGEKPDPLWAD
jgi:hypothetical protein